MLLPTFPLPFPIDFRTENRVDVWLGGEQVTLPSVDMLDAFVRSRRWQGRAQEPLSWHE